MPANQKPKRNPNAAKVSTISESGATINIGKSAKTQDTVVILFRSRMSQTFRLSGGKSVTLNGNAVYLANSLKLDSLPQGGYGITILDRELWEQVKREKMKTYGAWFRSGKIKEFKSESKGVNYAIDHADEKTGNDPVQVEQPQE